jgi:hypothetical protein
MHSGITSLNTVGAKEKCVAPTISKIHIYTSMKNVPVEPRTPFCRQFKPAASSFSLVVVVVVVLSSACLTSMGQQTHSVPQT